MKTVSIIDIIYSIWDILVHGEKGSKKTSQAFRSVARPEESRSRSWCVTGEGSRKSCKDLSAAESYAGGGEGCTGPLLPSRELGGIDSKGML